MLAFSIFSQQPFSHFPPQQDEAVLSFPQSLQQDAPLSAFMQAFASLPPQQDLPSFREHDMASLPAAE